ncbi:MarR family transcriptional regulator [Paenibacillus glacialis]|uniref:MarR family transcriptional regulator n=1 Tax=Paenibacillus glacialis TaxID=494026 RepID=A0A168KUL3_9BACL|nr:MarR family transcriptional regulator [Paenibacillus glacialis]OAB42484.1 MarR family transcriptional regulator [Paenibacillus glacialis]
MLNEPGKQTKDRLIKDLIVSVTDLQNKIQRDDGLERQWLIQNSPTPVIAQLVKDMTVKMLHVLNAIGELEPVNGITISKQFGFSKGNVSKITRRLADKKIIDFEYLPDNRKEILFRTTQLGKEINVLHQTLHDQIDIGINHFLQRYNKDELRFLVNILQETLHTSWIHSETNKESNALSNRAPHTNVESDNDKETTDSDEINEVIELLNKLDSRNLKKAKAILNDVFFSVYED